MDDYSVFFKEEPSPFIWLPLAKLKKDYICVVIRGYPVPEQTRLAFWVAGNGKKTMFYFTNGLAEVIDNGKFKLECVLGAQSTKVEDGRIQYLMDEGSVWKDLGPISEAGVVSSDSSVESMKRVHSRGDDFNAEEEEEKQLEKVFKHDFWSKGGKF